MTCEHCVRAVTNALEAVAGVEIAEVSLAGGRARVDGEADPQALLRAVEKEGYEAKLVEPQ
jgi:copper chaperone